MTNYQLDFSSYITERTQDFTGREWVFAEIDHWLADPNGPTFFIITGEPGIGKTAIAGRLSQIRDIAASHFCIARQADTIDPVLFARSISQQLCRIDGFAARILNDSNIDLKSSQKIQTNYGTAIGIKIEKLILNAKSPAIAFTHSVTQPLKELYASGYDQQIIILIDALDEAAQHKGYETIVDLLANAGDLPHKVRFVLTSRPEGEVTRNLEQRRIPYFRLDASRPENLEDIDEYVGRQLVLNESLRSRLADQEMSQDVFIEQITRASRGNFLYLVWLLPAIAAGTQHFDNLATLPQGLDGIYREFLRTREVGEVKRTWRGIYRPILSALVAAQSPLTASQITQFTDLSSQDVDDGLQDLRQFLDSASADQGRYFLYHQSINDWLQDKERSREFWIDVTPVHQRILSYYRQDAKFWDDINWVQIDSYGFNHLAGHLFALSNDTVYRSELYHFVCQPIRLAKRDRTGSDRAFAIDVDLAVKVAAGEQPPNWVQMGRAGLLYAMLGSIATNIEPAMLGALAACGQMDRALAYTVLIQDAENRFDSYLSIAQAFVSQQEPEKAATLLKQAVAIANAIQDDWARSEAFGGVVERLIELVRTGQPQGATEVIEAIQDDEIRSNALGQVVTALAQTGQPKQALDVAETIQDDWVKLWALGEVVYQLAQPGQPEQKADVLERALSIAETIQDDEGRLQVLNDVAGVLAQNGQPEQAATVLQRVIAVAETIQDDRQRSQVLSDVAKVLAQNGQLERAIDLLDQAIAIAETITDGWFKWQAMSRVAEALAQTDQLERAADLLEQAFAVAETFPDNDIRWNALSDIAIVLAQIGQAERAVAVVETFQDNEMRWQALSVVAEVLAQSGQTERAISITQTIKDTLVRSEALSGVVEVLTELAKTGQPEQANVLEQAIVVAESIQNDWVKWQAMRGVTEALAQTGQTERAADVLEQAIAVTEAIHEDRYRAQVLSEAASALAQAGQTERAAATLEQALRTAMTVRAHDVRSDALAHVAEGFFQVVKDGTTQRVAGIIELYLASTEMLGQTRSLGLAYGEFIQVLTETNQCRAGKSIAATLIKPYHQTLAQISVATCLQRIGQLAQARNSALAAAAKARKIAGKQDKITVFTRVSRALHLMGETEHGQRTLDLAVSAVSDLKQSHHKAVAFSQVAITLASMGQLPKAVEFALAGREEARLILKRDAAIDCLAQTAIAFADADRRGEGLIEVDYALSLANGVKDDISKARAWSALSRTLIALDEVERGSDLIKSARSILSKMASHPGIAAIQAHLAHSLEIAGLHDQAVEILQVALLQSRYLGRDSVLQVLAEGSPVLAAIDNGATVWQIYQAIQEIESWWNTSKEIRS